MSARTQGYGTDHLLAHTGIGDMRTFYDLTNMLPTSSVADVALIRSHIAYHQGSAIAARSVIRPSRGHTYKVDGEIVRIVDHYDHRWGVSGLYLGT